MRERVIMVALSVVTLISCGSAETGDVTGTILDGGAPEEDAGSSSAGGPIFCPDDGNPCTTQPVLGPDCNGKPVPNGTSCGRECSCLRGRPEVCYVFESCVGVAANGMAINGKCSVEGGCCTACLRESGFCMVDAPPGCGFGGEICHACP